MKKSRCLLLLGFALMFGSAHLSAADGLLDVLVKAKLSDPAFLGAGFERRAEYEAIDQARADLLPSVSFTVEEIDNSEEVKRSENTVTNGNSADYNTSKQTFSVSQSIYDHSNWLKYGQAKVVRKRADADFDLAQQDLFLNVSERYFTVLKTREQLAAISAEKDALNRHVEYANKSRRAGLGRLSEVVDAEARYYTALAEEAQFQKALSDARYDLMKLTGVLHEELRPIQKALPLELPVPADPQEWIALGLSNSPDLVSQQFLLDESRLEIKVQNSGHYPTLQLEYRQFNTDQGGSLFGGSSEVDKSEIALQLNIPIYQGGGVSSRKREAIERMYKAQEDLHAVQRSISSEVSSAYQGVVANVAQVNALKRTVSSQQSVLDNKQRGYQSGLYTMLVVLDAQRDLADAQRNYIEARYTYAINTLKLKRSAGILEEADLVTMNSWLQ